MNTISQTIGRQAWHSVSLMGMTASQPAADGQPVMNTAFISSGASGSRIEPGLVEMIKYRAPSQVTETKAPTAPDRAEIVSESIKEKGKDYDIDITYPRLSSGLDDGARKLINDHLKAHIDKVVKDFSEAAAEATPSENFGSEVQMGFTEMGNNGHFVSISFGSSTYIAGCAHPSNELGSFNFDSKTGNQISFKDIFAADLPEAPDVSHLFRNNHNAMKERENAALKKVVEYCSNDLKKQNEGLSADTRIDESLIESVTAPDLNNYNVFNLTDSGIVVNFYYCHAAGYGEVKIPYQDLADILSPDGVLGQYAKREEKKPQPKKAAPDLEITDDMIIIDDVMLKVNKK
ncbi:MAG: DUF3298 and DUF4163 domain-containing protein [Vulcanimicrobiota bacterium]